MSNASSLTEFYLFQFVNMQELQLLHFWIFLGIYLAALLGNGLIITTIVFMVVSYVQIFRAVLRIPSEQGRHKAFSTCLPHLAVVSLFISTAMFAYLKPPSISSPVLDLVVTVLYSVVPPALNPLMYSMRNQDLKDALWKLIQWTQFH
ncbi:olfactory receptor 14A2-like [Antrostomus carolinensis]|uniref:olfactory receptor 14A2-like n=1 Tax=Antrostomus carolinensis TaxID=279965 RepID=UPI0010A98612|nr:olfactory receptor 14A2-like [Antrostomus carolinensis]